MNKSTPGNRDTHSHPPKPGNRNDAGRHQDRHHPANKPQVERGNEAAPTKEIDDHEVNGNKL
ncbi:hypothetical protein [Aquipseudomonas campi]